jgi:hypothetical protein
VNDDDERVHKYQKHSDTSRAAAHQIEADAATLRGEVYRGILRVLGGRTDEELQIILDMNPSTERPRRVELVERGLVRDSGKRRRTLSKRWAVVWEVVPRPPFQEALSL